MKDKEAKEFDPVEFYAHAFKFGLKRMKNKQDAEDFRAYAVYCWLKYGRTGNLQNTYIDWLRMRFGRKFDAARHALERDIVNNDHAALEQIAFEGPEYINYDSLFVYLPVADTIVLNLHVKWGFNAEEIADLFGVTPARISQIRKEIRERIEKMSPILMSKYRKQKNEGKSYQPGKGSVRTKQRQRD